MSVDMKVDMRALRRAAYWVDSRADQRAVDMADLRVGRWLT